MSVCSILEGGSYVQNLIEEQDSEEVFEFFDTLIPEDEGAQDAWLQIYAICTEGQVYLH